MASLKWGVPRSILGSQTSERTNAGTLDLKAVFAEFIGTFFYVTIGCGAAVSNGYYDPQARLGIAFAFGMSAMVILYAMSHHSGGHLNCAVSFSLFLGGELPFYQCVANILAQLSAGLCAAGILAAMFPCQRDMSTTLGSNIVSPGFDTLRVLVVESLGTALWCFIYWETAVTPQARCGKDAALAIGFAVFAAHLFLLPIDGCSINPTRSFGPALVSLGRGCENYTPGGVRDLWIMWIGPLFGSALAAFAHHPFALTKSEVKHFENLEKEMLKVQRQFEDREQGIDSAHSQDADSIKADDITLEQFDDFEIASKSFAAAAALDNKGSSWFSFLGRCFNVV